MKEEIDNSTIRVGYFNMTLSIIDRTMKQKINRETEQHYKPTGLKNIYKTFNGS